MAKKGKIILRLIHSTLPCSFVTKVVYYHQCMIINMYEGISPLSKVPTGCDRPVTLFCSKVAHPPGTSPTKLNLLEMLIGYLFALAQTNTHFTSISFLSSVICAPQNSLMRFSSKSTALLLASPVVKAQEQWKTSELPLLPFFISAPTHSVFSVAAGTNYTASSYKRWHR